MVVSSLSIMPPFPTSVDSASHALDEVVSKVSLPKSPCTTVYQASAYWPHLTHLSHCRISNLPAFNTMSCTNSVPGHHKINNLQALTTLSLFHPVPIPTSGSTGFVSKTGW